MIVRAPRPQAGYTVLRNETLSDRRLSWAARGLLAYLLSKPDHWRVSPAHLVTETEGARVSSGRDAVYALLGELEDAGYIVRAQARGEDGRMTAVERHIHETPQPAAPLTAQPETVEPHPVNPTVVKTEEQKVLKPPTPPRASARAKGQTAALPLSPTVIELPLNDGSTHAVNEADVQLWARIYPAVDIRAQLLRMLEWCHDNPRKLKTRRGIGEFIKAWLSDKQDNPRHARHQPTNRTAPPASAIERVRAANAAAGHQPGIWADDDQPF